MRTYKPKEVDRELVCTRCGSTYVVHDNRVRKLCPKCQRERWDYTAMNKKEKPVRNCHDCDKATTDYRCPKCLAKWQLRNHVNLYSECMDGWEEVAC